MKSSSKPSRGLPRAVFTIIAIAAFIGLAWAGRGLLFLPSPLETAKLDYERGSWEAAAAGTREILKSDPEQPEALALLARAESRLGRNRFARNIYRRMNPEGMLAEDYFLVGRGLIADGLVEDGRIGLERALSMEPNRPEALLESIRINRLSDRLVEAAEQASRLANLTGWEVRGLVLLGLTRLSERDVESAARAFQAALEKDERLKGVEEGSTDEIRVRLARALLGLNRPGEAREQLKRLTPRGVDDRETRFLLSRAALQEGDTATAATELAKAEDFGEDSPERHEPAPYVGTERCRECHATEYRNQRASRHAQTFLDRKGVETLSIPSGTKRDPVGPEVTHDFKREGDALSFGSKSSEAESRAIVEFVLGSGDRARTLVGRDAQGAWRELRLSYYGKISDWDRTPGHRVRPEASHEFLGMLQTPDSVRRCLGCHTTRARLHPDGSIGPTGENGFSCERCHGPAGNHLIAADRRFSDPAVGRPRLASPAKLNALCGQCHSAAGRAVGADDPDLARFQATAIPLSRCVSADREVLSCLRCHNPHKNAETSHDYYEAKCLECHAGKRSETPPELAGLATRRVPCPVNPSSGCVTCHMPRVQTSVPHTTFTDHYIRVHREAGK